MKGESRLFSVGDLCVDVLQEIAGAPEFGKEKALRELDFSVGGNAANFAVISAKLGLQPTLVSVIGSDFATQFLKKGLAKAKVKAALIKSGEQNAFSIIVVNRRGERAIQSAKNCLEEINPEKVVRLLLPELRAGDIVFFGGFYHLRNMRKGFLRLLKKIKSKKAVVCFDTCFDTRGVWGISAFLPFIDFLFVNDIELKHIAKGGSMRARAGTLLKKGAGCVAVKQAAQGATLFRKGLPPLHFHSVARKVVDSTGAGDAFNAGFVFGLLHGWSLANCMFAGNFVAAGKIAQHGLAAPSAGAVEKFAAIRNESELIVEKNYAAMSKRAAEAVADLLARKPDASLALATGETPKLLYKMLASEYKNKKIDFGKARFFALDEYVGLPQSDKASFSYYLKNNFLGKVNAKPRNIFLLNGAARNLRAECAKHEAAIRRFGIDLCILGIGRNGHVAFNEPGACSYSITRMAMIKPETRKVNGKN
ncbi:MAG: PfkB family carbohydrate kinase, partial [Candidatus Diapherotrites archaeon]|nr:PfkB family carbohydrate kinase [Candidatus Diapherotrites archaeon]